MRSGVLIARRGSRRAPATAVLRQTTVIAASLSRSPTAFTSLCRRFALSELISQYAPPQQQAPGAAQQDLNIGHAAYLACPSTPNSGKVRDPDRPRTCFSWAFHSGPSCPRSILWPPGPPNVLFRKKRRSLGSTGYIIPHQGTGCQPSSLLPTTCPRRAVRPSLPLPPAPESADS